jgi:hypothetical protein
MTLVFNAVPAGTTIYIPFASYGKTNGESITLTGLAVTDIEVYKNGSATQRASDNGYTLLDTDGIDFDGITGIHGFSIDLSDNSDASFYAVGSWYWVAVSAVTIDSQTVNFVAAVFRIVAAEGVTGKPKVDVDALLGTAWLTPGTAGTPDVNAKLIGATAQTGRDIGASVLLSSGTGTGQLKLASGYVAMTWADIAAPTTSVALTGTTIATTQKVDLETIKTNPVVNAGTVTFPTTATLASTTNITGGTITTVTNLTNAPTSGDLTATMKASVNTEIDTALADVRLDELLAADSDIDGAAPPTVGSVFHELMTKTAGSFTYDQTTDSLEALRDRGDAAWITATGFSTHTAADVWAVGTRTLTAATNITSTGGTTVPQTGDAYARLGAPAGVSVSADVAAVKTDTGNLVARITSTLFSGITYLSRWLGAVAGKTADSSTLTEIQATTAGAGYTNTTDSLEALRDRGDAAWTTATGFSTLDAAGVRTAVGLASANLDTQLSSLPTAAANAAAILAAGDVDGYTLEQTLKLCLAALAGKLSGAATTTITIRAADDSKARITATVDSSGNRSAITLDATG